MNKELLEVIDNMIERLALIELHTGKSEGTPIDKKTLLDIQRELKSQELKDSELNEALEIMNDILYGVDEFEFINLEMVLTRDLEKVKKALLKAQRKNDKEIAFDLINTKDVDIKLLKWAYPDVEAYNVKVRTEKDYWWREELTKEEFEFLGRMVGAE